VKALMEDVKRKHKAVDVLEKGKAQKELESLEPEEWHGKKVLAALVHGNALYLRELSKQSSADVVFLVSDDGSVFAASTITNVGTLVGSLAKEFGGGGGGPPAKGEGRVPPAKAQALLDKAKERLKEALK